MRSSTPHLHPALPKRNPKGFLGPITLLSCALSLSLMAEQTPDSRQRGPESRPQIVPADAGNPYGKPYPEWTAAWWQWAAQVPLPLVPYLDPTGSQGSRGQSGPVWFLAGNAGGTTTRTVTVPEDKALFFPIMNLAWIQFPTDPPITPECVADDYSCIRDVIRQVEDNPKLLRCEIDGREVKGLSVRRYDSVPFDLVLPDNNFMGQPAGLFTPNVDNGYYVMVRPLSRGQHVLRIQAINSDASWSLDVTYHLTVAPSATVYPPKSHPYGRSYPEWAVKWWQWSMSIPTDGHHPAQDEVGVDVARGQKGNVWFLTGVFNASGTVVREVTVPPGKALFFPAGNTECSTLEPAGGGFHGDNEAELRDCATGYHKSKSFCEIDGRPVADLEDYHFTSPMFDFTVPEPNVLGTPAGSGQAVDDGIYLMVPPLSPGKHTVRFGTFLSEFQYTLDITYHITVPSRRD